MRLERSFMLNEVPSRDHLIEAVAAALCLGDHVSELHVTGSGETVRIRVVYHGREDAEALLGAEETRRIRDPWGLLQHVRLEELEERSGDAPLESIHRIFTAAASRGLYGVGWFCGSVVEVMGWIGETHPERVISLFNLPLVEVQGLRTEQLILMCCRSRRQVIGKAELGIMVQLLWEGGRNVAGEEGALRFGAVDRGSGDGAGDLRGSGGDRHRIRDEGQDRQADVPGERDLGRGPGGSGPAPQEGG